MYEIQIEEKDGKRTNLNIEDMKQLGEELEKHPGYTGVKAKKLVKNESSSKKDK